MLTLGPSRDSNSHVCFIDSIRVWGQTKEAFGWPEDAASGTNQNAGVSANGSPETVACCPVTSGDNAPESLAASAHYPFALRESDPEVRVASTEGAQMAVDRLTACALETLAVGAAVFSLGRPPDSEAARAVSTCLLAAPSPPAVCAQAERLLASLYAKRADFLADRDACVLERASDQLEAMVTGRRLASVPADLMPDTPHDFDVEVFQEVLSQVRRVALARPRHLPASGPLFERLVRVFEDRLLACRSQEVSTAPLHRPSISELESTAAALVEVLHTRLLVLMEEMEAAEETAPNEAVAWIADVFTRLIVHADLQVSSAARAALCRLSKLPKPVALAATISGDTDLREREDESNSGPTSGPTSGADAAA